MNYLFNTIVCTNDTLKNFGIIENKLVFDQTISDKDFARELNNAICNDYHFTIRNCQPDKKIIKFAFSDNNMHEEAIKMFVSENIGSEWFVFNSKTKDKALYYLADGNNKSVIKATTNCSVSNKNLIFKQELTDIYGMPISDTFLFDNEKDNFVVNRYESNKRTVQTLGIGTIQRIKEEINKLIDIGVKEYYINLNEDNDVKSNIYVFADKDIVTFSNNDNKPDGTKIAKKMISLLMYSNMYNSGTYATLKVESETDEEEYYVVTVTYDDSNSYKFYYYTSDNHDIKENDRVLVERGNAIVSARVLSADYKVKELIPFPVDKLKKVVSVIGKYMSFDEIKEAYKHTSANKYEISQSNECRCICCGKTFINEKITNWEIYDEGPSAVCPYCEEETVIGDASGYNLDDMFYKQMSKYYFDSVYDGNIYNLVQILAQNDDDNVKKYHFAEGVHIMSIDKNGDVIKNDNNKKDYVETPFGDLQMFFKNPLNGIIKMVNFFVDVDKDDKTGRNVYWITLDTVNIPLNSEITIGFDKNVLKPKVFSGFHEMIAENSDCTLIMTFYDPQYATLEKDWSYKVINKDGHGYTYRIVKDANKLYDQPARSTHIVVTFSIVPK